MRRRAPKLRLASLTSVPDASAPDLSGPDPRQFATLFTRDDPLVLEGGATLGPVEVAYETWGELNADASNAVFVLHALTGDSHTTGWWDTMVGPGLPVNTDRFFVICPNLLGGCRGTTGPSSIDPATGEAYGLDFPLLSMRDLVVVHRALMEHLGIGRLLACVGGSLGGMQVLQWALDAPTEIGHAVVVAASSRLSAQNIAFSAVARSAIMRDPDFDDGRVGGPGPRTGLAIARMMAHITYLSEAAMAGGTVDASRTPTSRGVASASTSRSSPTWNIKDSPSWIVSTRCRISICRDCSTTSTHSPTGTPSRRSAMPPGKVMALASWSCRSTPTGASRPSTRAGSYESSNASGSQPRSGRSRPHTDTTLFLLEVPDYLRTVAAFLDHAAEAIR